MVHAPARVGRGSIFNGLTRGMKIEERERERRGGGGWCGGGGGSPFLSIFNSIYPLLKTIVNV
jgi:hypothetical protein